MEKSTPPTANQGKSLRSLLCLAAFICPGFKDERAPSPCNSSVLRTSAQVRLKKFPPDPIQ